MPPRVRPETAVVSLAAIRELDIGRVEVLFLERQQIFTLSPAAAGSLPVLRDALADGTPVKTVLDPVTGEILQVFGPTPEEVARFERDSVWLPARGRVWTANPASINEATLATADLERPTPSSEPRDSPIPDERTLTEIFDYCFRQACYRGGPFDIVPCIPFQYVRDGCFARAHKMRQVITEWYGYGCEKVFSFAPLDHGRLAVKADRWGGCCVTWWFHVAPLVKVIDLSRAHLTVVTRVVDPSLFDRPVTLDEWLLVQANRDCAADAAVATFSIQPGFAYTPNLHRDAFTTDDDYVKTDRACSAYRDLQTCTGDLPTGRQRIMTVARVRDLSGADFVEVLFLESARVYRLARARAHFDQLVALLLASAAEGRPVRVTFTTEQGDEIEDVRLL